MSERQRLPCRRRNSSRDFVWEGSRCTVTVGWSDQGTVRELFLKGGKLGTHLAIAAEDDGFLISRLLQRGDTIAELSASFFPDRAPFPGAGVDTGATRPSLIAVAVQMAARIEEEEGAEIASIYRQEMAQQTEAANGR